jgi:hypothetical protein
MEGRIHTASVVGQESGNVILGDWIETKLVGYGRRISSTIAPTENRVFPFLVPITKPGLYYIALVVSGTAEEIEDSEREHAKIAQEIGVIRWLAETYVRVQENKRAENDEPPNNSFNPTPR